VAELDGDERPCVVERVAGLEDGEGSRLGAHPDVERARVVEVGVDHLVLAEVGGALVAARVAEHRERPGIGERVAARQGEGHAAAVGALRRAVVAEGDRAGVREAGGGVDRRRVVATGAQDGQALIRRNIPAQRHRDRPTPAAAVEHLEGARPAHEVERGAVQQVDRPVAGGGGDLAAVLLELAAHLERAGSEPARGRLDRDHSPRPVDERRCGADGECCPGVEGERALEAGVRSPVPTGEGQAAAGEGQARPAAEQQPRNSCRRGDRHCSIRGRDAHVAAGLRRATAPVARSRPAARPRSSCPEVCSSRAARHLLGGGVASGGAQHGGRPAGGDAAGGRPYGGCSTDRRSQDGAGERWWCRGRAPARRRASHRRERLGARRDAPRADPAESCAERREPPGRCRLGRVLSCDTGGSGRLCRRRRAGPTRCGNRGPDHDGDRCAPPSGKSARPHESLPASGAAGARRAAPRARISSRRDSGVTLQVATPPIRRRPR